MDVESIKRKEEQEERLKASEKMDSLQVGASGGVLEAMASHDLTIRCKGERNKAVHTAESVA